MRRPGGAGTCSQDELPAEEAGFPTAPGNWEAARRQRARSASSDPITNQRDPFRSAELPGWSHSGELVVILTGGNSTE